MSKAYQQRIPFSHHGNIKYSSSAIPLSPAPPATMNRITLPSLLIATMLLLGSCALSCSASRAWPWPAPPGPVWTRQDRQGEGDDLRLHEGSVETLATRRRRLGDRPPLNPPSPTSNEGVHTYDAPPSRHWPPQA